MINTVTFSFIIIIITVSISIIVAWMVSMFLNGTNIFSTLFMSRRKKIVVFDLDETIGCFVEVSMFWEALKNITGKNKQDDLFDVLDIFPEFSRPDIFGILNYLDKKKRDGSCDKIMIYTNNQGPRSWARDLSEYFSLRSCGNDSLFDQIIAAFKVRGKLVEMGRTSHDKSVDDFFRCTQVPKNAHICFLDDTFHPLMQDDEIVYYLNLKPYYYSMPYRDMANRYYNQYSHDIDMSKRDFVDEVHAYMSQYNHSVKNKSSDEESVDRIVSKQIRTHLKKFFRTGKYSAPSTKKKRTSIKRQRTKKRKI